MSMHPPREKRDAIRILVVDDHRYFRESLADFLSEDPGVEVIGEAKDGIEAQDKAAELSPDVIIMDIKMPRQNGVAAAECIKDKRLSVKIILYSMNAKEFSSTGGITASDRFIPKQRLFEDLFQTLNELVRLPKRQTP